MHLSTDGIKQIVEGTEGEVVLQAIIVQYYNDEDKHKNTKAKIMISDGIWAKTGENYIKKNDIICVKKCSTKFVKKGE